MILCCRDGACMPGLVVPPQAGYPPWGGLRKHTLLRASALRGAAAYIHRGHAGWFEKWEHARRWRTSTDSALIQSPKESGMCNKDKRETLWRLWGCEVNLNIFIRPSGGSYNTRSEMHALYTTFTLFFVASYGTNPCLRAFSNISLVTPAIKRSPVAWLHPNT